MIFFPQDPLKRMRSRKLLEMILAREGLGLLFWRDVPVCPEILSEKARSSMPAITQCFIRRPVKTARGLDFDRKLYLARREYEHSVTLRSILISSWMRRWTSRCFCRCCRKRGKRLLRSAATSIFPVLTVHSARSSVQRSRDAGAARWRMIPTRSTAAAALDSRSVHFCRRA